jgi:hypothetical protein
MDSGRNVSTVIRYQLLFILLKLINKKLKITEAGSFTTEVKDAWGLTSTPPYAFMTWCLSKYKDNFTFT